MKSIIMFLVLLVTLCMVLPVRAQVHLGVLGGLNMANLSLDQGDMGGADFSSRTVYGFGGVLDYSIGENIALRFEPMYLQ